MTCIGFIGLGAMGLPLAARLAGHTAFRIRAFDPDENACRRLLERTPDADIVPSANAAARGAPLVAACLPNADAAKGVFGGLAGPGAEGQIWMDFSTHDAQTPKSLSQTAKQAKASYIEAPVVGGVPQAEAGALHVLVSSAQIAEGGALPALVRSVLDAISSKALMCGGPGQASTMKLLQNGLGLMQLAAIAEVIAGCDSVGIDKNAFCEFVQDAPGMANTPLFERVARAMCAPKTDLSARLSIAAKDMQIARDLMAGSGARADMAETSSALFAEALQAGLADHDFSRIVEIYRAGQRRRD